MSDLYPIVAVTGSSGAGTSQASRIFNQMYQRERINPVCISGDSFHFYNREEMQTAIQRAEQQGHRLSHFGPEGNLFEKLEKLFCEYSEQGTGLYRRYLHTPQEAQYYPGLNPGQFTPWEFVADDSELLFYEGLHGGLVHGEVNVARYVDLLIGITPIVNLEWIQKIHRDRNARGYSAEASVDAILRRMHDYVHYIAPQFGQTHINFQRVPTVDTSNPFIAREIPTLDESFVVIHVRDTQKLHLDFPYLLSMIHDSFMSRRDTIVVPAGKAVLAADIIFTPVLTSIVTKARRLRQRRMKTR